MEPLDYLHLQMRLEGKALVDESRMRQEEMLPGEEMPLVLLARLADGGQAAYYDEALPPDLYRELAAIRVELPEIEPLLEILKARGTAFETGHYKTYLFPSMPAKEPDVLCLPGHDAKVQAFGYGAFAEGVYAIERAEGIAAACVSVRENDRCGEAWVYTEPKYRGQGFAQRVVRAWARGLMEAGKVPLFSHRMDNLASAGLARKLGLQPVFEEITISRI